MHRLVATALLGGVLVVATPLPATACSPSFPGRMTVSKTRVAAGERISVRGEEGLLNICPRSPVATSPTPGTDEAASPAPDLPLPPLGPAAGALATGAARPARAAETPTPTPGPTTRPSERISLTLSGPVPDAGYEKVLATATPRPPERGDKRWFAAEVTIPAGLAPGQYRLEARQPSGLMFGAETLTVVAPLAATGAPAGELTRLGLLALLAGGLATAAGTALRRRAAR